MQRDAGMGGWTRPARSRGSRDSGSEVGEGSGARASRTPGHRSSPQGAGSGGAPLCLGVSQECPAFVTTDPQPLPGGKPSGNGGCCRPSPCPAASRADRSRGGLAPMGGLPGTLPASPDTLEGRGSLFHFPEVQGRTAACPRLWPPRHPRPTALGQDSGPLGCGAGPRGRGAKPRGRSCLPWFSLLAAGARSLQVCGGPAGLQVTGTRFPRTRGLQSLWRCSEGMEVERRPEPGPASRVTTPGPCASEGPARRGPQGGTQPVCACRPSGWSEGRHAGEDRAGRGVEAPPGGTPPGAREGRVGLRGRRAEPAAGLQAPALWSEGRPQRAQCPPADWTHK